MNDDAGRHPTRDELRAFALGRLDEAASAAVEAHLAACAACRDATAVLGDDDSLVSLLRGETQAEARPAGAAGDVSLPPELLAHPRYRVLGPIGSGGMGAVYKAEHLFMERAVALKVVGRELTADPALVARFVREVKAAARLVHPNIVHAYDADQAGGVHFLVMEYVEGQSLDKVVRERGPLPAAEACDYVRQAALGLQHAHEQGMVHRDVKPHNLMLTPDGRVKVLDFGLARFALEALPPASRAADGGGRASLTQAGAVMGTPDYIAPEQARDARAADGRADIYSLGFTLYFLLSGRVPFPDESSFAKIIAHLERSPRPLGELRRDLPAGLLRAVERMTAKDPAKRYQTPAEAAAALAPFAGRPARKRWPAVAALSVVFAVALPAYLVVQALLAPAETPPAPPAPEPPAPEFRAAAPPPRGYVQASRPFGPEQALGEPDTSLSGDHPTAWAPKPRGEPEWLLLEFPALAEPLAVKVHQTHNPGGLGRVTVFDPSGAEVEVWVGKDPSLPGVGQAVSEIPLRPGFKVRHVCLYFAPRPGPGAVDAVGLVDTARRTHWAVAAVASGSRARHGDETRFFFLKPPSPSGGLFGGRGFGPEQATGAPDTQPGSDLPTAWASKTPDAEPEWLTLEFDRAVSPKEVRVHQTLNPGALVKVTAFDAGGNEAVAWEGQGPAPPGARAGISVIPLRVDFETKRIKLYLDSPAVRGFNEIDAVALVGRDGGEQWATAAAASSTYSSHRDEDRGPFVKAPPEVLQRFQKRPYGPEQATGEPDTPPGQDVVTAWASQAPDGGPEWLELEYERETTPKSVRVHETLGPGALVKVTAFDAAGNEAVLWEGRGPAPPGAGFRVWEVPVRSAVRTRKVKLYLDSKAVPGWNEIDAVALIDESGAPQWAESATASSTYADRPPPPPLPRLTHGRPSGPEQATGEPDTLVAGDWQTAWASRTPDEQDEWLLLVYDRPVSPKAVRVYESYNPGALARVTVFDEGGKEHEVWSQEPRAVPQEPGRVSEIPVWVDVKVRRVKLYLGSKAVPGWNEIDAVGLVDVEGKVQWATSATASSSYGDLYGPPR